MSKKKEYTNEEIKEKFGKNEQGKDVKIHKITVNNGERDLNLYLTQPTRYQISPIIGLLTTDMVGAVERLISDCVIGEISDFAEIMEDDTCFLAIMPDVVMLIEQKKSTSIQL